MLVDLAQRAASIGWVYDLSQTLAGVHLIHRRLQRDLATICKAPDLILDIGGGTGKLEGLAPLGCRYYCLDLEMPKLQRYARVSKFPRPILADAAQMPIPTGSVDLVTWIFIAHHLNDQMMAAALAESERVLKDGGRILFLDPVFSSRRLPGRMLWRMDRGSHPRSEEILRSFLNSRFQMEQWDRFAIYHRYLLGIGRKRP